MDLVHKTSKHTNFSPPHQTFDSLNLGIRYPVLCINFIEFWTIYHLYLRLFSTYIIEKSYLLLLRFKVLLYPPFLIFTYITIQPSR